MDAVAVQFDSIWQDKAANCAKARRLLSNTTIRKGSLVIFPELFSTGFSLDLPTVAEGQERQGESFLAAMARKLSAYLLGGVMTTGPDGRGQNQAVVFDPGGDEVARYAKMHLFSPAGEADCCTVGEQVITFRWGDFTVAPFICYDLRFPEIFRAAVRKGADLFVVIASWPQQREAHWATLLRARAIENQAYVVGVNRCGSDPNHQYSGRSMILDPRGQTIVEAGNAECIIHCEPSLQQLMEWRNEFPAVRDMRPD